MWFVENAGNVSGPHDDAVIRAGIAKRQLARTARISDAPTGPWTRLADHAGFRASFAPQQLVSCGECRSNVEREDTELTPMGVIVCTACALRRRAADQDSRALQGPHIGIGGSSIAGYLAGQAQAAIEREAYASVGDTKQPSDPHTCPACGTKVAALTMSISGDMLCQSCALNVKPQSSGGTYLRGAIIIGVGILAFVLYFMLRMR